jgi:hypothetical protein
MELLCVDFKMLFGGSYNWLQNNSYIAGSLGNQHGELCQIKKIPMDYAIHAYFLPKGIMLLS